MHAEGRLFFFLLCRPGKNPPQNSGDEAAGEKSIKLLVYMLERAVQSLKRQEGKSGITFIIDYNGYTNANQPPLGVALRFVDIFQNFYPERLASAFVIDTPWYFSVSQAPYDLFSSSPSMLDR